MPQFEWDPKKAATNLVKHGVSFDDAKLIWDDPGIVMYVDGVVDHEQRWRALGTAGFATVFFVVYVHRDSLNEERVRIISARKATPRERKDYAQANL